MTIKFVFHHYKISTLICLSKTAVRWDTIYILLKQFCLWVYISTSISIWWDIYVNLFCKEMLANACHWGRFPFTKYVFASRFTKIFQLLVANSVFITSNSNYGQPNLIIAIFQHKSFDFRSRIYQRYSSTRWHCPPYWILMTMCSMQRAR